MDYNEAKGRYIYDTFLYYLDMEKRYLIVKAVFKDGVIHR